MNGKSVMKNKGVLGILILIILGVVFVSGCVQQEEDGADGQNGGDGNGQSSTVDFQFARKIEVGNGIFSGIIFANDHFYVSFEVDQHVYVKEYDENFTAIGEQHQLTGDDVSVADHQTIFADNCFYLVHSIPPANALYLKKFDSDWNEIKSVLVVENASQGESTNDMVLYYTNGYLYVGSTVHAPPRFTGHMHIRKYDQNLELKSEFDLDDVSCECGSSIIFQDGTFIVASSDRFWDDANLIIIRYDANWNFIDSKTISDAPDANERFPMALLFQNGRYFVSYTYQTGDISSPPPGEMPPDYGDLILKAFDQDWNLLGQAKVTDDMPPNKANRAHLALTGGKIYVAYDSSETGSHKISVKEYTIRLQGD